MHFRIKYLDKCRNNRFFARAIPGKESPNLASILVSVFAFLVHGSFLFPIFFPLRNVWRCHEEPLNYNRFTARSVGIE